MDKIYVVCPLDGDPRQKDCSLVEHFKENGTMNECQYQAECRDLRTHVNNEEGILNEIK